MNNQECLGNCCTTPPCKFYLAIPITQQKEACKNTPVPEVKEHIQYLNDNLVYFDGLVNLTGIYDDYLGQIIGDVL